MPPEVSRLPYIFAPNYVLDSDLKRIKVVEMLYLRVVTVYNLLNEKRNGDNVQMTELSFVMKKYRRI
jgi:hypothetical protein